MRNLMTPRLIYSQEVWNACQLLASNRLLGGYWPLCHKLDRLARGKSKIVCPKIRDTSGAWLTFGPTKKKKETKNTRKHCHVERRTPSAANNN